MATRYVVDTSMLVYALDRREHEKREACQGGAPARRWRQNCGTPGAGSLRIRQRPPEKARAPAEPDDGTAGGRVAHARLAGLAAHRARGARSPAERRGAHALLYAAQIWAVARLGQVAVVLSEDFNPGTVLDGVSFTNPLDPTFDLAALG
jgi:hypothetical protein